MDAKRIDRRRVHLIGLGRGKGKIKIPFFRLHCRRDQEVDEQEKANINERRNVQLRIFLGFKMEVGTSRHDASRYIYLLGKSQKPRR